MDCQAHYAVVLGLALSLFGCGAGGFTPVYSGPAMPIAAVYVSRVDLRVAGTEPWNHYEKLRDAIAEVEKRPNLDVIAPWEIERAAGIERPGDWLTRSTLKPRAALLGIPIGAVAVLRTSVEERTHTQTTDMAARDGGHVADARGYGSVLVVRAAMVHPSSGQVLARIERRVTEDRFVATPDYDPRPALRALLVETIDALLEGLDDAALWQPDAPPLRSPMPEMIESPARVLTWREGPNPTLAESVQPLDPVDRTAKLYARFRYADPEMSLQRFERLVGAGPGLIIGGHRVERVSGLTAQHTFQLRRVLRRYPDAPIP